MTIITDQSCASYHTPGHPERPTRVTLTQEFLYDQTQLALTWTTPTPANDEAVLRAHTPEHIGRLRIPRDFDADTAFFPNIEALARNSVGAALLAVEHARRGEAVFSLMRPPPVTRRRSSALRPPGARRVATVSSL